MDMPSIGVIIGSVVMGAAPVVMASLGETISERAGVINLSLDGTILLSAMVAFAASTATGSLMFGFAAGIVIGGLIAAIVALSSIYLLVSQVAVGFVLSLACRDLAYFLGNPFSRIQGLQVPPQPIPVLGSIPFLGPAFFNSNLMVYLSYALIGATWWYLYRTRWGLELRAVGEYPQAAYARGINPKLSKIVYTVLGGLFVGLAGATYSLSIKPGWGHPQGAEGIGWIALAIVIFGGWHPVKVAIGAYFFSLLQVMGIYLQNWLPAIPAQVFQVAPFPLMIFTLVLVHVSQGRSAERLMKRYSWIQPLVRFLKAAPPRALGKT